MIPDPGWRARPWGIIADDLTGATDTAAAFARQGFPALVILDRRARRPISGARVFVLSTRSRQSPPAVARRRAQAATQWLRRRGVVVLYKKMDSTLHGNIAVEVAAIRDAAKFETALVCPANPAQGRLIRNGRLTVHGEDRGSLAERLSASTSIQRPRNDPISKAARLASVFLPLAKPKLRRALRKSRFVLADATTDSHLRQLAAAGIAPGPKILLAGSAGLAAALAVRLSDQEKSRKRPPLPTVRRACPELVEGACVVDIDETKRPFLIFSGSTNAVTQQQIKLLERRGKALVISLGPKTARLAQGALSQNQTVVIRVPVHTQEQEKTLAQLERLTTLLRKGRPGGLLIVGGDTALLICRWLRPQGLAIEGEILPGLAWGRCVGGLANGMRICTKPGGFGDVDALMGFRGESPSHK